MTGAHDKFNAISWNVKTNRRKSVHTRGYKLPTNVQNSMQKYSAEMKILLKVVGGLLFDSPCMLIKVTTLTTTLHGHPKTQQHTHHSRRTRPTVGCHENKTSRSAVVRQSKPSNFDATDKTVSNLECLRHYQHPDRPAELASYSSLIHHLNPKN